MILTIIYQDGSSEQFADVNPYEAHGFIESLYNDNTFVRVRPLTAAGGDIKSQVHVAKSGVKRVALDV